MVNNLFNHLIFSQKWGHLSIKSSKNGKFCPILSDKLYIRFIHENSSEKGSNGIYAADS
jgi:hypothetical protein